jgi:hypothetical protein
MYVRDEGRRLAFPRFGKDLMMKVLGSTLFIA